MMTDLTYNLSRQQAADLLWVSTRSIDRYVKKWELSYKKVANKVFLSSEEIARMQEDFDLLHQHSPVQKTVVIKQASDSVWTTWQKMTRVSSDLWFGTVKEFSEILQNKDGTIEEKNQLIYMLQRKIGELETWMQQMIALPDYSSQKEEMMMNIQKLELEKKDLEENIRKEKLMNTIFLGLALVAVVFVLFFTLR